MPIYVVADPDLARTGILDPEDEMGVYRVVQEALSNAIRYAHAQSVKIEITSDGLMLTVSISDDGVGFDPKATEDRGLGLAGMRERALILRADFAIESTLGKGSTIAMTVPLPPAVSAVDKTAGSRSLAHPRSSR
jgi:signal transduction histidine kinase